MGALQDIQEAVGRLDLQQEGHGPGQHVQIRQQDALGAQALPLERQIAGHRGGATGPLGGHHREDLGGLLALRFDRGLQPRHLGQRRFELIGGERLNEKINGAGAQAPENEVRIVSGEQRQDLNARSEAHHFAQQLVGLIAVRRHIQEDQMRALRLRWPR